MAKVTDFGKRPNETSGFDFFLVNANTFVHLHHLDDVNRSTQYEDPAKQQKGHLPAAPLNHPILLLYLLL